MRARLLAGGAEAFIDQDLLEYLLALAIPRRDTKPIARQLLTEFGSFAAIISAEPAELTRIDGLGEGAVAALKAVQAAATRLLRAEIAGRQILGSWQSVLDYLHASMAHGLTEQFRVLFLNNRNMLIRDEVLSHGTVNQTPVYVREVIKRALELGASALILVHNHPSGDTKPSRDDIDITNSIVTAGKPMGLVVHDHIVIGTRGHSSFRSLGLL